MLFYHRYLFLNYWFIVFNSCSYCTNFNPFAEFVIPVGIPRKETKTEFEIHPVTAEA